MPLMSNSASPAAVAAPKFPPGIPYIVGNEAAERFSFYGMRAILYVYLSQALFLGFPEEGAVVDPAVAAAAKAQATKVTHLFMAGVYLFPLIGAMVADRFAGKYRVIIWLSMVYVAGHAALSVVGQTTNGMYLGLALIAIGSGGIKPCVSANVGDQFTKANASLVSRVFQLFYFMINFGSFFSTLLIPVLYQKFGPDVAFGVPGILMALAALVFWMGRNKFVKVPPQPGGALGFLDVLASVCLFVPFAMFAFAREFIHEAVAGTGLARALESWPLGPDTSSLDAVKSAAALAEHGASWATAMVILIASIACIALWRILFLARQRRQLDSGFLSVLTYCLSNQRLRQPGMGFFDVARAKFGDEAAEGPPAVLRIVVVFSMISVFWALFDQHSSTWVEQAVQMDLSLSLPLWIYYWVLGVTLPVSFYGLVWILLYVSNVKIPRIVHQGVAGLVALSGLAAVVGQLLRPETYELELHSSQISAVNPLLVMIIIPLLNAGVYMPLEKRGITIKPLQRMTAGMFLAALAFVVAAVLQTRMDAAAEVGEKISVLWQFVQYTVMTVAEVLVSVTGLEFAYTQAPRAMKSTIMGFWLLCVTVGNLLVAALAFLQTESMANFFWTFATLMGGAAVIFAILAYFYKGRTYLQNEG